MTVVEQVENAIRVQTHRSVPLLWGHLGAEFLVRHVLSLRGGQGDYSNIVLHLLFGKSGFGFHLLVTTSIIEHDEQYLGASVSDLLLEVLPRFSPFMI